MSYIKKDGTEGRIKGYIVLLVKSARYVNYSRSCEFDNPMISQEGDNPFNNIESYDNFFYSTLQVAIISTQSVYA